MQTTSNLFKDNSWLLKQEELISALKEQPLIIVVRIDEKQLEEFSFKETFLLISHLINQGVKNIEIAWSPNQNWAKISKEIVLEFKEVSFGAASITNNLALKMVNEIGFSYSMCPFWDSSMILEARSLNQLLIPGIFSPSEIQKALKLNCKIIKLFPASSLGINYLNQIKVPFHSLPLIIAAGGLKVKDLDQWLAAGYNAIALGRGLFNHSLIDPMLKKWLDKNLT